MKKNIGACVLLAVSAAGIPSAAFAFEVSMEQATCPIVTLGDAELDGWAGSLSTSNGELTGDQQNKLAAAVRTCADKNGWNETDIAQVAEFNVAVLVSTGISDRLKAKNVDAERYETVLDDVATDDLQLVLNDPENSQILKKVTDMLVEDLGDKLTDEIAADVGSYIALMAQSQLVAMKMLGITG